MPDDSAQSVAELLAVLKDRQAHLFDRIDAIKALVGGEEGDDACAVPQRVVDAIHGAAENEGEEEYLCRTAGECLGRLWCRAGTYDKRAVKRLTYDARRALLKVLGTRRPELIPDSAERRVCRAHLLRLAALQEGTLTERPDEDRITYVGEVEGHPFRLKVKIKSGDVTLRVKLQRSPGEFVLTREPEPKEDADAEPGWQKGRPDHQLSPTVRLEQPDDAALALIAGLPEALRSEVAQMMDDCSVSELQLGESLFLEFLMDVHNYDEPDEPLEPDEEPYDMTTSVAPALVMAGRLASALEGVAPPRSLKEAVRCPYCETTAYLTADLKCPNCDGAVL